MTVTKADLVNSVLQKIRLKKPKRTRQQYLFPEFDYEPLTKKRAAEIVDSVFEIMKKSLEKGDPVLVPGFGKFKAKFKWARKGRNPKTGETMILDSRRVITFQCSPKLRVKIMAGPPQVKKADKGAPSPLHNSDRSKTI
jgi:integration host factor subunit alpha